MLPKQTKWFPGIKLLIIAGILLFSFSTTTTTASAMTLNVHQDFFGFGLINDEDGQIDQRISVTFDETTMLIDVGEFQVRYNETSGYFPAFCVDLENLVHYGENKIDGIMSPEAYTANESYNYAENGLYVEWLVDYAFSSGIRRAGSATAGAGLQLAIWEVLYDFDDSEERYNLNNNGFFSYNNDHDDYENIGESTMQNINEWYEGYINRFIEEVDNGFDYTSSGKYKVVQLSTEGGNTQDFITVVPEPATMLLFGIGLLGIGALGRKRQI